VSGYNDLRLWEEAWKHTPSVEEFKQDYHGRLTKTCGVWVAIRMEPAGDMEVTGNGDTPEAAVQDWWENRLNALAPEELQAQRMILMLRGGGDPKYQHVRIKGYDDDE
jgi:hypothetical protein